MKLKSILAALVLCAAALFGLSACGDAETYTYTLNYANLAMSVGQQQQLSVTSDPEQEFSVVYESSDPAVAEVSADGTVTAVAAGNADITATADGTALVCKVRVTAARYVWSLNYGAAIVGVGGEVGLQASVTPQKEFSVTYSSSDTAVASVSQDGKVTGVAEGAATITADVGETKLVCEVYVSDTVRDFVYTLSDASLDLYETAEAKLTLEVLPERECAVSFSSSDPAVASVDAEGNVTALSEGTAEIYAEADGQRFVCTVNVRALYVLNYKSAAVKAGETLQLSVTNAIDESAASGVTYASDAEQVASVSESGLVTAAAEGTAIITASVNGRELTCIVTVTAAEEGDE